MTIETALRTNERVAALVDNLDTIATLPQVTARISATVNNPKSTASELHKIISHDPALVSRILRLANSSLYALRYKIDSVERAIVLLGFYAVHNLAVTATISTIFNHDAICEEYTARDLWTHSVGVAAASRELAKRVCPPIAEQAFLAGLLHDVGLLVELQVCPDKLREICREAEETSVPFATVELASIGCNHAELGAALATRWGFPEFCRVVAACHHYPALADPQYRQLASIVYVADTLCCQDAIGFDLTAGHQVAETVGFEGHVPLQAIEYVREHLPELVSDAVLLFSGT